MGNFLVLSNFQNLYQKLIAMKTNLLLLFLLGWLGIAFGQENSSRLYVITATRNDLSLKQKKSVTYEKWSQKDIDSVKQVYKDSKVVKISEEVTFNGEKQTVMRDIIVDDNFYKSLTIIKEVDADWDFFGYVKFDGNKVYVSRKRFNNKRGDDVYYFKLKNGDKLRLPFIDGTVSVFTIPFKYRFKQPNVSEEFSSASLNINVLAGVSFGRTTFMYRENVDCKTNNSKFTVGIFGGSSIVELTSSNTSAADEPLAEGVKITKGLASIGLGAAYSFNKISLGGFLGWDYAIGNDSEKWNYNKKPWIGIAIGYSLFNL